MFSAYIANGIGIWIGIQSFFNIGVNIGILPTKGLTLPFMSYGGSAVFIMLVCVTLLLRIDYETAKKCAVIQWSKTMSGKTFMLMAGGTGGHIFPALAVAESLQKRGHHVIWLGSQDSMEERIVPQYGIRLETLGH